jgi:protein-S-isoprenylcysteine O-methyltransferase Ste14
MALQEEMEIQGNWLFKRRGSLPLIIIAIGLAVYLVNKYFSKSIFLNDDQYEKWYEVSCLLVSLLGQCIRIFTIGFSQTHTSGRNTASQLAESINTKGIYSIVRHPLYLGNFFMWLGVAMLTADFWFIVSFVLVYAIYYERIMFAEEQFLRKKFGDVYLEWASKTPAFFPAFNKFQKDKRRFSWRKIFRHEKKWHCGSFHFILCL